jgi:hypothetical protein
MPRKLRPEFWELETILRGAMFDELSRCIQFVEDQIVGFDDQEGTEFNYRFGPQTQSAFLIVAVAQMETQLKTICELMKQMRNLKVDLRDLRGSNGFDSCVQYLIKVLQIPIPEEDLARIRSVVALRNALVHEEGYIGELPKNIANEWKSRVALQDGYLVLIGAAAQEACASCKAFVQLIGDTIDRQTAPWRKR